MDGYVVLKLKAAVKWDILYTIMCVFIKILRAIIRNAYKLN